MNEHLSATPGLRCTPRRAAAAIAAFCVRCLGAPAARDVSPACKPDWRLPGGGRTRPSRAIASPWSTAMGAGPVDRDFARFLSLPSSPSPSTPIVEIAVASIAVDRKAAGPTRYSRYSFCLNFSP